MKVGQVDRMACSAQPHGGKRSAIRRHQRHAEGPIGAARPLSESPFSVAARRAKKTGSGWRAMSSPEVVIRRPKEFGPTAILGARRSASGIHAGLHGMAFYALFWRPRRGVGAAGAGSVTLWRNSIFRMKIVMRSRFKNVDKVWTASLTWTLLPDIYSWFVSVDGKGLPAIFDNHIRGRAQDGVADERHVGPQVPDGDSGTGGRKECHVKPLKDKRACLVFPWGR